MKIVCVHCAEIMSLQEWPEWMEQCPKKGCDGGMMDRFLYTNEGAALAAEIWGEARRNYVSDKES